MYDMQAGIAVLMQKMNKISAFDHSDLCIVEHFSRNFAGASRKTGAQSQDFSRTDDA
jgi:hypothetical protein